MKLPCHLSNETANLDPNGICQGCGINRRGNVTPTHDGVKIETCPAVDQEKTDQKEIQARKRQEWLSNFSEG